MNPPMEMHECSLGCRVCFLAEIYGLIPREVTLIALISAGKSGRAISRTLGVGMPTIRQYCARIHRKIGTRSRLGIGLWAIRKGMVMSGAQPKSDSSFTGTLTSWSTTWGKRYPRSQDPISKQTA
jgi:DNA-binding CsgD family transcriptional regulator